MKLESNFIIETVLNYYGQTFEQVSTSERFAEIVKTRQIVMFLLREYMDLDIWTFRKIGLVWNLDHATAIHACNVVRDMILTNKYYRREIEAIREIIDIEQLSCERWNEIKQYTNVKPENLGTMNYVEFAELKLMLIKESERRKEYLSLQYELMSVYGHTLNATKEPVII